MPIYQNDTQFPRVIRTSGCYLMSIYYMLYKMGLIPEPTYQVVMRTWIDEVTSSGQDQDINAETFILDPQGLVDGIVGKGRVIYDGKVSNEYTIGQGDWIITHWSKGSFGHFTFGDYDPWAGGSPTKAKGMIDGYRKFRKVEPHA